MNEAEFRVFAASLKDRYGDEIGPWLAGRVVKMFDIVNDPCVDNVRVCEAADEVELAAYEKARGNGCCGSYDDSFTHDASGRTFMVGCNYGH